MAGKLPSSWHVKDDHSIRASLQGASMAASERKVVLSEAPVQFRVKSNDRLMYVSHA